jgi:hypothetical protein
VRFATQNAGDDVRVSRRTGRRALAVSSLAAAVAAGLVAVLDGLGSSPTSLTAAHAATGSRSVDFDGTRLTIQSGPGGRTCASFDGVKACALRLTRGQIVYASSPTSVGGVAGSDVRAVIVKLTRKGTVWADLSDGAFYARIPPAYGVRAVVKVLHDGSRRTFAVTASR